MPSPFQTRNIAHLTADFTTVKTVVASTALTAADTGKLIVVDLVAPGADTTITLPAPVIGLTYRIIVWKDDDGSDDLIVATAASTSLFKGGVIHADTNADNLSVQAPFSSEDTWTFVDAEAGTDVTFVCDGTHWYTTGVVVSADVPTIA
tara:strand:+ start:27 stop:473 length:447 start_codon:yes stop_codon:yes gene_type:complete